MLLILCELLLIYIVETYLNFFHVDIQLSCVHRKRVQSVHA